VTDTVDNDENVTGPEVDAWKQMHDLQDRYTREWEVRSDLEVTALGTERSVRLRVGDWSFNKMKAFTPEPQITDRNVGTMRELAAALNAACDFVEQANPKWAGLQTPSASLDIEAPSDNGGYGHHD
jgi:hypothetical protein